MKVSELPKLVLEKNEKVILMYGLSGTGKSSFSLLLNGKDIFNPFKTSGGAHSKTLYPEIANQSVPFLGIYEDTPIRTIDTKGLFDNKDISLEIESFMRLERILRDIQYLDKIMVVFNGKVKRFDLYH